MNNVCLKCEYRQRPCAGPCACTIDGADITEHVRLRSCPHPNGSRFDQPIKAAAVPRKQWPLAARVLAKLATPQDRGIGDTIARIIDPAGGALLKRWYKRIVGSECGCADRQARLNAIYPYPP